MSSHSRILHPRKKFVVQEVHDSSDDTLFPDKDDLTHNLQNPIFHHVLLKSSDHRSHGHKNIPPLKNLISCATYSMSSLSSFSNCDDTTVDYNMVKSEATNITSVTVNSRSWNDIASDMEKPSVIYP